MRGEHSQINSRIYKICALITLVSALVSLGFSLAPFMPNCYISAAAMYTLSRSAAIVIAVLAVIYRRSYTGLLLMAGLMTLVQGGDAIAGLFQHDFVKTFGPLFLAILTSMPIVLIKTEKLN